VSKEKITPHKVHKLSLVENSHSFMSEAVKKAIAARDDVSQWPFAVLNLVQATELSLKELLRLQHPVLIFEDIDFPRNTLSITQALSRIENPHILGIIIPEGEKKKIINAVKLRNQITHFEFELTEEYAMAKFSEIFAFLVYFQGRYLKVEVEDILQEDLLQAVIEIEKCFSELRSKAIQRIHDEKISPEWVWECPHCGEDTFVIEDGRNVCFLCRKIEEVVECSHCRKFWFVHEIQVFFNQIASDYDEGQVHIYNDYGYSQYDACPECIGKIRDDIERKRAEEYWQKLQI
jgi:Zn finger protein HypA/HybF involved in hydrogenase expression